MLLTARHINKVLSDNYVTTKFKKIDSLKDRLKGTPNDPTKKGCKKCSMPDIIKEGLYTLLQSEEDIYSYFKELYGTKNFHIFFVPQGKKTKKLFKVR